MDFADPIVLEKVKSGKYDIIFHQAAVPRVSYSVEHPGETTDTNIGKTVRLMEAAAQAVNSVRFIFASSSSVYGGAENLPTKEDEPKSPVSPYAMQKSVIEDFGELFCKLYDMEFVSLRYFNVFGPNQYGDSPYATAISAWCHAVKHGLNLRSDGDGEQTRDLCYIDNVVDANVLVAEHEGVWSGECFNVACGDRTSNNQILKYFKDYLGVKDEDIVHAPVRAGDVKHTQADVSSLEEAVGYVPRVRIWEGLRRTLDWWDL
jgi:UDP-glucose 4-epimerase